MAYCYDKNIHIMPAVGRNLKSSVRLCQDCKKRNCFKYESTCTVGGVSSRQSIVKAASLPTCACARPVPAQREAMLLRPLSTPSDTGLPFTGAPEQYNRIGNSAESTCLGRIVIAVMYLAMCYNVLQTIFVSFAFYGFWEE